jgi:hypothetical protein
VVLVIGYIVAKVAAKLVAGVLHRGGLDRTVHSNLGGGTIRRILPKPSATLGTVAFWMVFLSGVSLAVSVLGIDALKNLVATIWSYLPNVLAALVIFLVAAAISAAVAGLARRVMGDTPLGKVVQTAVPVLVMTIATFMILDQLRIAHNIVVITYAALLGAIALGSALAFGLGGRDVAARMLEGAYSGVQDNKDQWRRDMNQGVARARSEAQEMRNGNSDEQTRRERVAQSVGEQRYPISDQPAQPLEEVDE